jgi:hypothetical protein
MGPTVQVLEKLAGITAGSKYPQEEERKRWLHQVRPGITVATHVQEIADFLFYEDLRDVVLLGTSSGGMVIQKAAELALRTS